MTVEKILRYAEDGEIKLTRVAEESGNYLIHRDILRHQLSQKQGTVATKTRSEVRGGGKKPWQQKGTGRARAGSSRSPLWRGGGVIFGPKPKTTKLKLNKKERRSALQTLLYNKKDNIIGYNGDIEFNTKVTPKEFREALNRTIESCKLDESHYKLPKNPKFLVVVSKKSPHIKRAYKNLKNVELIASSSLNTLSLLKADLIMITPSAMKNIKEIYCD
jgi:large subunit ribosomal protein L4